MQVGGGRGLGIMANQMEKNGKTKWQLDNTGGPKTMVLDSMYIVLSKRYLKQTAT